MQTTAVFKSIIEQVPEDRERVRDGLPIGSAIAQYLVTLLNGVNISTLGPIADEADWMLYPTVNKQECFIIIGWTAPNNRNDDLWVLRSGVRLNVWQRTFDKRKGQNDLEKLLAILVELLEEEERKGQVRQLCWMTEEEFWNSYIT